MKKTKADKTKEKMKRMKYAFGTGISSGNPVFEGASNFLGTTALQGLGTILNGMPNSGIFDQWHEGGQILAMGGEVGPDDPITITKRSVKQNPFGLLSDPTNAVFAKTNYDPTLLNSIGQFVVQKNNGVLQGDKYFDTLQWGGDPNHVDEVQLKPKLISDKAAGLDNNYTPARDRSAPHEDIPMIKSASGRNRYANGGQIPGNVPVEVEGNEVAQTPDGMLGQFTGPTHEEGGIDADLPAGTKIYSDRLSVDGKTMQERKLARERKLAKLDKILSANKTDAPTRNTYNRSKAALDQEEENDLMMQEAANQSYDPNRKKFAFGGAVNDIGDIPGLPGAKNSAGLMNMLYPWLNPTPVGTKDNTVSNSGAYSTDYNIADPHAFDPTPVNTNMGLTTGDKAGLLGKAFGAISPLVTTVMNRAGDKPNVNSFKNFGNDAITSNDKALDLIGSTKDSLLQKLQLQATGQRARNRNSATGVNTARALDLITTAQEGDAAENANSTFAQQMAGLYTTRGQLQNQRDLYQDQGAQAADLADRRDRDAYYSNLGQNFANISNITQSSAKDLNQSKLNNDTLALLPELSKYGLGFVYDKNGKPVLTKAKN